MCNLMLLRCDTIDEGPDDPILQLVFTFEISSLFFNSRDTPTARKELVIAVIPLIIDAINDIFSSI